MVRVRFAPSPTGFLHIGGARTALFNYVFAKANKGDFILRLDDTDPERSKKEFEVDISKSLEWLGIAWTEGPDVGGPKGPYRQSEKTTRYHQVVEMLLSKNAAYKDTDGTIRLRYPGRDIVIEDVVCGTCTFVVGSLGPEPVMLRADGSPTYHLASVVDDFDMGITHVIRGQDHLTNTAKHALIFEALEAKPPTFVHLPLILGEDGSKLSKRSGQGFTMVKEFQEAGYLPEAVNNFLMQLGWSHPEAKEFFSIDEVIPIFNLERVRHTASVFETTKLKWLNGQWIRSIPTNDLASRSRPFVDDYKDVLTQRGEAFWIRALEALKTDMQFLPDAKEIARLLFSLNLGMTEQAKTLFIGTSEQAVLENVLSAWKTILLEFSPEESDAYSEEQYKQIVSVLKKRVDAQSKILFQALRVCLTGDILGPELKVLVPLLSHQVLLSRCNAVESTLKG